MDGHVARGEVAGQRYRHLLWMPGSPREITHALRMCVHRKSPVKVPEHGLTRPGLFQILAQRMSLEQSELTGLGTTVIGVR